MFLGDGWSVSPAGGATGEAYIAQHGNEKLFLKRNSSPFLAVLSAEGIVPKLLWTKRLENGDVITAQRWVHGRELKSFEMKETGVAKLLAKIHRSCELLYMFKRIGNEPLTPLSIKNQIKVKLQSTGTRDAQLEEALEYLAHEIEYVQHDEMVVCHSDVNHNNWILGDDGQLYLIDWDNSIVADPALDLGLLLYLYIPESKWSDWLTAYGVELSEGLKKRMHWYVVSQAIFIVLWHQSRMEHKEVEKWRSFLKELLAKTMI